MADENYFDVKDLILKFQNDDPSLENPFDKTLHECSYGHDIDDVIAKRSYVIFGDYHHELPAIDNKMAEIITTHRPGSLVVEIGDRSDQRILDDIHKGSIVANSSTPYLNAAIKAGTHIIRGDLYTKEEKATREDAQRLKYRALSEMFNEVRREENEHNRSTYIELASEYIQEYDRMIADRDPNFASELFEAGLGKQNQQSFLFVGREHVPGVERYLEKKLNDGHDAFSTVYIIPVSQDAMGVLEDKEGFKVESNYVLPVLDQSGRGKSLQAFLRDLDTLGTDYAIREAKNIASSFDAADIVEEGYDSNILNQCSHATWVP